MSGGEGMEGTAGTGFLGLASAILEAVASIDEQMGKLKTALDLGNSYFTGQIDVINEKYIPAWENLRTYQMMKKFEEYFAANKDAFIKPANAMNNAAEVMKTVIETINNNNTMNRNINVDVGGVHVHGVQNPEEFSDVVNLRIHNKILQEMHKY